MLAVGAVEPKHKAYSDYENIAFAVEAEINADGKHQAEALLIRAKVTRATAKLVTTFVDSTAISELRPLIQKEVKALRNRGLQEGDALHPLLVHKIRSTLAMRG
eukprot:6457602-Amphidinium_carterae.1